MIPVPLRLVLAPRPKETKGTGFMTQWNDSLWFASARNENPALLRPIDETAGTWQATGTRA